MEAINSQQIWPLTMFESARFGLKVQEFCALSGPQSFTLQFRRSRVVRPVLRATARLSQRWPGILRDMGFWESQGGEIR